MSPGPKDAPPRAASGLSFVILCLGRTGSTHLQFLLDSHSEIRCFGELFSPNSKSLDEVYATSGEPDPLAYVSGLAAECAEPTVGFKLPMGSIRAHPESLGLIEDPALRFIRLRRANLLALLASRRLLATTRVPQSTHGSYGEATIRLEPEHCIKVFERIEEHDDYLDSLAGDRPTHHMVYEDLVAGRGIDEVQSFLGVEPEPLTSVFERVRKRTLAETIENWDELEAGLRGTRYEAFLADDLTANA